MGTWDSLAVATALVQDITGTGGGGSPSTVGKDTAYMQVSRTGSSATCKIGWTSIAWQGVRANLVVNVLPEVPRMAQKESCGPNVEKFRKVVDQISTAQWK